MPDKSDTQFDTYLALGTSKDRRCKHASFPMKQLLQNTCHIMLEASLFTMSSVMMALGLPLCFFLLLSGWDLLGLFTHLDNVSSRYLEADGARRLVFSHDLKFMFAAAAALVTAIRMPHFLSNLMRSYSQENAK